MRLWGRHTSVSDKEKKHNEATMKGVNQSQRPLSARGGLWGYLEPKNNSHGLGERE